MVETVIKHLTEFKQMTEAAIPFRLLNEQGEINCARAAEKIIKNQVADIIPSLREETLLYLMENPEAIDCLGKLKKEEDSLNMERFQKILSNVENDKLSDIGYGQMKKIYFDPMIPDEAAYHYMKYYGKLDLSLEEKEQLVNSLTMCIGELDFDRAGEKGRMLLFQPVFSSDLLLGLLEKPKTIESLEDPELLKLVNTLAGYKAGIEPLNQNQFDQLREKPGEILEKMQVVTGYIPKDLLSYGLQLWLWNGALYADLCKLERIFMDGMGASEVFKSRVSYVNTLYQNPLSGIDLSGLSYKKSELLLYAITQKKKNFLRLIQKEKMLFDDLPDNSLLLEESVYREYLNLNTVNKKNLKESADLILPRRQFHDLKKRMYTFEELKLLCRAEKTVICLYGQLTCMRIDDQICVLRELLKRKCMPRTFQDGQLGILAKALSIKPLSRWIREDFGNIRGLSYETAVWLLVYQEQLKGMEKEITKNRQATEMTLITAVNDIIEESGFEGLGINAVAAKAKVSKMLIYRYFNSLDGLIAAYIQQNDYWINFDEELPDQAHLAAFIKQIFKRQIMWLRENYTLKRLYRWELTTDNKFVKELRNKREEKGIWLVEAVSKLSKHPKKEIAAMASIITAAISYLALLEENCPVYNGLKIQQESGWEELEEGINLLVDLWLQKQL